MNFSEPTLIHKQFKQFLRSHYTAKHQTSKQHKNFTLIGKSPPNHRVASNLQSLKRQQLLFLTASTEVLWNKRIIGFSQQLITEARQSS